MSDSNILTQKGSVDEPHDIVKEKAEKALSDMQDAVAADRMKQLAADKKRYEDALNKRMLQSLSLENIFIESLQKYGNPYPHPSHKTQNIYYGAQSSIDNGINILAVGTTPDEAIQNYIEYISKRGMTQPFKLYPISYTLYTAIHSRDDYKISLGLTPKSVMVDNEIDPDTHTVRHLDSDVADGMVDLMRRVYPYPTVDSFKYLMDKFKDALCSVFEVHDTEKVTVSIDVEWKHDVIFSMESNYTGDTKYVDITHAVLDDDCRDVPDKESYVNEKLFWYFHGHCISIFNQVDSSSASMGFQDLLYAWKHSQLFTIYLQFVSAVHLEKCTIQCIFPHADMAPKISIQFA